MRSIIETGAGSSVPAWTNARPSESISPGCKFLVLSQYGKLIFLKGKQPVDLDRQPWIRYRLRVSSSFRKVTPES